MYEHAHFEILSLGLNFPMICAGCVRSWPVHQEMLTEDLLMVTLKQTDHVSPALAPASTLWTFCLECVVPSNHTLPRIALFRTLTLPALAVSAHRS